MKNFPEWRFDFSDDWQEKTLGEVAEFLQGLTYSPENISNDGVIVLRSSNIQNDCIDYENIVRVNISADKLPKLKENDILMCVRNGSKSLVGKTALISKKDLGNTWGAFMMIIRSPDSNSFLYQYFKTNLFTKEIYKDSGTTTINQITKETLSNIKIKIPSLEEQKKIGEYFAQVDASISAQDKKLENWRILKKGLLQKIFSREYYFVDEHGNKYPDWQEKTLDEVCKLVQVKKLFGEKLPYFEVKYLRGLIEKNLIDSGNFITAGTKIILVDGENSGEIFTAPENGYLGSTFRVLEISPDVDADFLQDFILTKKELYRQNKSGTAIPHLNKNLFYSTPLPFPCMEEQKKIAEYFSTLDKIIDAEEKILSSFKEMKRGLLQKIFV